MQIIQRLLHDTYVFCPRKSRERGEEVPETAEIACLTHKHTHTNTFLFFLFITCIHSQHTATPKSYLTPPTSTYGTDSTAMLREWLTRHAGELWPRLFLITSKVVLLTWRFFFFYSNSWAKYFVETSCLHFVSLWCTCCQGLARTRYWSDLKIRQQLGFPCHQWTSKLMHSERNCKPDSRLYQ